MNAIKIREMRSGDIERVLEIYGQGVEGGNSTFQSRVPTPEVWDEAHMEKCRLVAEVDGKIAGWVALTWVSDGCAYKGVAEVSIYIDSAHHGKGIGRKLLEAVIEASEKEGLWTLQATIMDGNIGSVKISERCGFRLVGTRERIDRDIRGKWRDTLFYERRSKVVGVDGAEAAR